MKTTILLSAVLVTSLAACATNDPAKAKEARAKTVTSAFPAEADQKGISLAFPVDSHLEIIYYPDEVSRAQVDDRVARYCQRTGYSETKVSSEASEGTVPQLDGSVKPAIRIVYDCD